METTKVKKGWASLAMFIGYILSPLSWWNDLVVNIPLSYAVATVFGLISRPLFPAALVLTYWLSNIAGLVLLHIGAEHLAGKGWRNNSEFRNKRLSWYLLLSLAYTLLIIGLVKLSVLRFPTEYF